MARKMTCGVCSPLANKTSLSLSYYWFLVGKSSCFGMGLHELWGNGTEASWSKPCSLSELGRAGGWARICRPFPCTAGVILTHVLTTWHYIRILFFVRLSCLAFGAWPAIQTRLSPWKEEQKLISCGRFVTLSVFPLVGYEYPGFQGQLSFLG